ncbi:MAG: hypothetical protein SNG27_01680 [Rikenellaceae bacterium]
MKDVISRVLSFNGISLLIGIIGGIFGVVSIFIDWTALVSIKWLIAAIVIFVFVVLILVKIINDAGAKLKTHSSGKFKVISIINNGEIVLTENSPLLPHNTMVSIYFIDNICEVFVGSAYVYHVQDEYTQIKIKMIDEEFKEGYKSVVKSLEKGDAKTLKNIIVRNIVKIDSYAV